MSTTRDAADLSSTANDIRLGVDERAQAVFMLFANYVKPGSDSSEVANALSDPRWVKQCLFYRYEVYAGSVVVKMDSDRTVFSLGLFPSAEGRSSWQIILSLTGDVDECHARDFFRGKFGKDVPTKLIEFALCFPSGRIELYGTNGMCVARRALRRSQSVDSASEVSTNAPAVHPKTNAAARKKG